MSWVKFDDKSPRHPKIAPLSPAAKWAWFSLICWCSEFETDGRFTEQDAKIAMTTPRIERILRELMHARLIDRDGEHYVLHDYTDYQPTKAERQQTREKSRKRKQRSRRDMGVTDTGHDTESQGDNSVTPRARGRDPVPSRPVPRSPLPVLSAGEQAVMDHLHAEVRTKIHGGSSAPPAGWCDDLIRRGALRVDVDYAVQATLDAGKTSQKYVRAILERRVIEREQGHDPDARSRAMVGGGAAGGGRGGTGGGRGSRGGRGTTGAGHRSDVRPAHVPERAPDVASDDEIADTLRQLGKEA